MRRVVVAAPWAIVALGGWAERVEGLEGETFRERPTGAGHEFFFVEIGTSDFDTLADSYFEDRSWGGVSVEPHEHYLASLPWRDGYRREATLVCESDGETDLYSISPEDIGSADLPAWTRGISSTKERPWNVVANGWQHLWRPRRHRCTSYATLMALHGLAPGNVDFLKVDTEGYDSRIVHMAVDMARQWAMQEEGPDPPAEAVRRHAPGRINFEYVHLSCREEKDVLARLQAVGYVCARSPGLDHGNFDCYLEGRGGRVDQYAYAYRESYASAHEPCGQLSAMDLAVADDPRHQQYRLYFSYASEPTQLHKQAADAALQLGPRVGILDWAGLDGGPPTLTAFQDCRDDAECAGDSLFRCMLRLAHEELAGDLFQAVEDFVSRKVLPNSDTGGGMAHGTPTAAAAAAAAAATAAEPVPIIGLVERQAPAEGIFPPDPDPDAERRLVAAWAQRLQGPARVGRDAGGLGDAVDQASAASSPRPAPLSPLMLCTCVGREAPPPAAGEEQAGSRAPPLDGAHGGSGGGDGGGGGGGDGGRVAQEGELPCLPLHGWKLPGETPGGRSGDYPPAATEAVLLMSLVSRGHTVVLVPPGAGLPQAQPPALPRPGVGGPAWEDRIRHQPAAAAAAAGSRDSEELQVPVTGAAAASGDSGSGVADTTRRMVAGPAGGAPDAEEEGDLLSVDVLLEGTVTGWPQPAATATAAGAAAATARGGPFHPERVEFAPDLPGGGGALVLRPSPGTLLFLHRLALHALQRSSLGESSRSGGDPPGPPPGGLGVTLSELLQEVLVGGGGGGRGRGRGVPESELSGSASDSGAGGRSLRCPGPGLGPESAGPASCTGPRRASAAAAPISQAGGNESEHGNTSGTGPGRPAVGGLDAAARCVADALGSTVEIALVPGTSRSGGGRSRGAVGWHSESLGQAQPTESEGTRAPGPQPPVEVEVQAGFGGEGFAQGVGAAARAASAAGLQL